MRRNFSNVQQITYVGTLDIKLYQRMKMVGGEGDLLLLNVWTPLQDMLANAYNYIILVGWHSISTNTYSHLSLMYILGGLVVRYSCLWIFPRQFLYPNSLLVKMCYFRYIDNIYRWLLCITLGMYTFRKIDIRKSLDDH